MYEGNATRLNSCLATAALLIFLGCGPLGCGTAETAEKAAFEQLQGTWKYVSHLSNGHPSDDDVGCYQVFVGNRVGRTWGKTGTADSIEPVHQFELNPDTSPKQIDILMVSGRMHGIYAVEGDKLTLCYPWSGDQGRPKQLKSTPGDMNVLYVLERIRD